MALRNVALLITNDNRQGIMETIIVLLALLSQILGLFGFVFSCLLFLRFGKVKGWFNKKAGTEIVSSFSFRSLRTLIVTGVLGFVMMMVGLLCSVGLFIDKTPTDTQMYWFAGTFVALTLVYPVWRVIRRIVRCSRAENRRAERWRLFYDSGKPGRFVRRFAVACHLVFCGGNLVFYEMERFRPQASP